MASGVIKERKIYATGQDSPAFAETVLGDKSTHPSSTEAAMGISIRLSSCTVKHSGKNKKSTRFPSSINYQNPIENDAPRRVIEACKSLRGDC
jgi:hypothetical protein